MSDEITLRDTFAAAALTGLLANEGDGPSLSGTCQYAYRIADAMLRERLQSAAREYTDGISARIESKPTLTDEEREAIHRAEARLRTAYVPDDATAATLRKLLERMA